MTGTPPLYVPTNPQTVAVTGTSASFSALKRPYYTLHTTVAAFFRVDGIPATVNGSVCFFLDEGASLDMYANPDTVVTIIASSDTGNAYITEWA